MGGAQIELDGGVTRFGMEGIGIVPVTGGDVTRPD